MIMMVTSYLGFQFLVDASGGSGDCDLILEIDAYRSLESVKKL